MRDASEDILETTWSGDSGVSELTVMHEVAAFAERKATLLRFLTRDDAGGGRVQSPLDNGTDSSRQDRGS
jgi:hypothetical protein